MTITERFLGHAAVLKAYGFLNEEVLDALARVAAKGINSDGESDAATATRSKS